MASNVSARSQSASRSKHLPGSRTPGYLGVYRIESLLGQGGGYLAWDERPVGPDSAPRRGHVEALLRLGDLKRRLRAGDRARVRFRGN